MRADIYEDRYQGLTLLCRRVIREGSTIVLNGRVYEVKKKGEHWVIGRRVWPR